MNYAIVENGVVVNIAVADQALASNWIQSDTAAIGDLYSNGVFTKPPAPPAPVPTEVSNAQAREALIRSGIPIASVNAALAAIADSVEREIAVTQWEYRSTIRRDAELVTSMAGAMNLTSVQVDDMFRLAATL